MQLHFAFDLRQFGSSHRPASAPIGCATALYQQPAHVRSFVNSHGTAIPCVRGRAECYARVVSYLRVAFVCDPYRGPISVPRAPPYFDFVLLVCNTTWSARYAVVASWRGHLDLLWDFMAYCSYSASPDQPNSASDPEMVVDTNPNREPAKQLLKSRLSEELSSDSWSDDSNYVNYSNEEGLIQVQKRKSRQPRLFATYEMGFIRLSNKKQKNLTSASPITLPATPTTPADAPASQKAKASKAAKSLQLTKAANSKVTTVTTVAIDDAVVIAPSTFKNLQQSPPLFIHDKGHWSEIRKQSAPCRAPARAVSSNISYAKLTVGPQKDPPKNVPNDTSTEDIKVLLSVITRSTSVNSRFSRKNRFDLEKSDRLWAAYGIDLNRTHADVRRDGADAVAVDKNRQKVAMRNESRFISAARNSCAARAGRGAGVCASPGVGRGRGRERASMKFPFRTKEHKSRRYTFTSNLTKIQLYESRCSATAVSIAGKK
ncbi:hypothetical protein EVAR_18851_1 [Eumeta japonica]|uniref:Uncharacterized protein n=1 Tax=Eumeta variegata TaxID=151549 RepID=A0A4C1UNF0_EUMVA|nr:hypothetical protein EVAR_18851_1 [Eumeta japonica]